MTNPRRVPSDDVWLNARALYEWCLNEFNYEEEDMIYHRYQKMYTTLDRQNQIIGQRS